MTNENLIDHTDRYIYNYLFNQPGNVSYAQEKEPLRKPL